MTRFADCADILRRYDAFSVALYKPKQGDYWMAQDDTPIHWREKSIMRAILDREQIEASGGGAELDEVPALPGLARPETQIAIPLLIRDRLVGMFAVESEERATHRRASDCA